MKEKPVTDGVKPLSAFFRLLDIDLTDINSHHDAINRLLKRDINGIIIRDIYDKDFLGLLVKRLEAYDPPFLKTWFPEEFRSWFYGRNLNLAQPDLQGYFEKSRQFHEQLGLLFPPQYGMQTYITGLLSRLAGGRQFLAAPGPAPHQQYMFTTIRCHLEGGFIPPHIDYEYLRRRSYHHLRAIINPRIISFVIALNVPERGGTLDIFNYHVDPSGLERPGSLNQDHVIEDLDVISIPFTPGSMFIFDSGRFLHEVTPVACGQNRWTICSFMAPAADRNDYYCWG